MDIYDCDPKEYHERRKSQEERKRSYLSIYWKCCHQFSRIKKNKWGTHYEGHCPKCNSPLSVPIGKGGTSQRSFIAE